LEGCEGQLCARGSLEILAFYDLLEKAIDQKALPVRARQVPCADGGCAASSLELLQNFQRLCEFFRRCGHRRLLRLAFRDVHQLAYYLVP